MIQSAEAKNLVIDFCWVPGHVGVAGNEKADTVAKEAASSEDTQTLDRALPHTDMKKPIRDAIRKGWQDKWLSLDREGRKLREIKRDVGDWNSSYNKNRRIETVLSRLRIGHTNITHSYLMQGQANPPECERCRKCITVKHILVECSKYATARNKYFRNPTLPQMVGETDDFSVAKLVAFLQETDLFAKI